MRKVARGLLNIVVTLVLTAAFVKLEDASVAFGSLSSAFFNSNAFSALQTTLHVDPNDADILAFCCYALPALVISIGIVYAGNRLFARKSKVPVLAAANRARS